MPDPQWFYAPYVFTVFSQFGVNSEIKFQREVLQELKNNQCACIFLFLLMQNFEMSNFKFFRLNPDQIGYRFSQVLVADSQASYGRRCGARRNAGNVLRRFALFCFWFFRPSLSTPFLAQFRVRPRHPAVAGGLQVFVLWARARIIALGAGLASLGGWRACSPLWQAKRNIRSFQLLAPLNNYAHERWPRRVTGRPASY